MPSRRPISPPAPRRHVVAEDVRIEPDASLPRQRRGLGIDAHFLELAHVAPQLERADLEQVAEKHASFQPVVEPQPQHVVFLRLAGSDPVHRIPIFSHQLAFAQIRESAQSQLNAPPVWYSITLVSKKLRSFLRSIISLIHGKGLLAPG